MDGPARRILAPLQVEGYEWAGVGKRKTAQMVEQTVRAVKQIARGDEVRPSRPIGVAAAIAIVLGAKYLLSALVCPFLLGFLF